MRKNEYKSLDEFTSQYIGEWNPSGGHWLGLDFIYHNQEYRFHTGSMYHADNTVLPDGREAQFGLYLKNNDGSYSLIEEFATMDEVLKSNAIENKQFKDVIMDDDTELVGQD